MTPGSRTALYKKDKHDLTGKLPPANLRLPEVPLSDVEIIVFFYNSSSRPVVAVRLYARGGPYVIAQIINEHRVVKPEGYKRNTCSVHCNKGVKTFIRVNGEDRKKQMSAFFEAAGDLEATNAIRHAENELENTCDFPMLGLFKDLIKLPSGPQAGIFTECVKWCQENQANAMISQAHLIAEALTAGTDPREKLGLPAPQAQSDAVMSDVADGGKDSEDQEEIESKAKSPAVPEMSVSPVPEDSSDSASANDEAVDGLSLTETNTEEDVVAKVEDIGLE